MTYVAAPPYGRKKAEEIIKHITESTDHSVHCQIDPVEVRISQQDLIILSDMLYEMNRHLPDFFEDIPEEDEGPDTDPMDSSIPTQPSRT